MKPYYSQDGITIYHGDAMDVLNDVDTKAVDLVLTDPPYNMGKAYGQHNDSMPRDEYLAWSSRWFARCQQITKRAIVFPGHGNLWMWGEIARPSGVGIWYKPGYPGGHGVFQFYEWEPWLLYGFAIGGSDVLRAPISVQPDVGDHPCPKPIKLFRDIAERVRNKKVTTILDPFMGTGTSLRAAKDVGLHAIGIEIEERYCEIAAKRLAQQVLFTEAS